MSVRWIDSLSIRKGTVLIRVPRAAATLILLTKCLTRGKHAAVTAAPKKTHSSAAPRRAFVSFSGGKDSMLALHRAKQQGVEVEGILCMLEESGSRSRSHGIPRALIEAQANALGLRCILPSASWTDYETAFVKALRGLKDDGITEIVFGDIDLDAHREWEEKVCGAAGLTATLPLWHANRIAAVRELLGLGYRARIVCVNAKWLGEPFAGRLFDDRFLADLPEGVDACGENGEFHTFVYDGPLFASPVKHRVVAVRRLDEKHSFGDATYYVADIA